MALRAWVESLSQENDEFGEHVNVLSEELPTADEGATHGFVLPVRAGSSVCSHGLTPEERREERKFQLQLAKLKMEAEERKAEGALAEKKLLLAHELSLKELDRKARQSESSIDGGSIHKVPEGDWMVCIHKNLVPSNVVGDDIDKWFSAYEVALMVHGVPEEQ
ncbi:hypothetical protein NDU88_002795 [Pleurodeles waltl]|uniref:Uncharacterized protein n=1 Tax=Pleurodeles waltl TaxID=8319 RepID=A0AAV7T3K9_PLEWA|nr:hypothetical protein NDU88_002795 [Pleurodeles waltl]